MPNRPVTLRRWEVAAAFILLALSYALGLYFVTDLSDQNARAIRQIRELRAESIERFRTADLRICKVPLTLIHQIILASDASLGQPGTPGFVYYRDHPDELRAAHRANQKFAAKADPAQCHSLPSQRVTP